MIRWLEKNWQITLFITIIIGLGIFIMSSLTFPPSINTGFDWKPMTYHFLAFFLLGLFLALTIIRGKYHHLLVITIIIAFLYGISDEIHQLFVPGRFFSFEDIMVDSAGILSASLIYVSYCRRNSLLKPKKLPEDYTEYY